MQHRMKLIGSFEFNGELLTTAHGGRHISVFYRNSVALVQDVRCIILYAMYDVYLVLDCQHLTYRFLMALPTDLGTHVLLLCIIGGMVYMAILLVSCNGGILVGHLDNVYIVLVVT